VLGPAAVEGAATRGLERLGAGGLVNRREQKQPAEDDGRRREGAAPCRRSRPARTVRCPRAADGHGERDQREREEISHVDAVGRRQGKDDRAMPRPPLEDRVRSAEEEHDADTPSEPRSASHKPTNAPGVAILTAA
jgi:hypothetical protein